MTLTEKFCDKIRPLLEHPDMAEEDYAYVLSEANRLGITTAQAHVWCQECETENIVDVDTFNFEWTCPGCGAKDRQ